MPRRRARMLSPLGAFLAAALVAGCGLQSAPGTRGASILVTERFGVHTVARTTQATIPSGETVLGYLMHAFAVTTRPGPRRGVRNVVAINGHVAGAGLRWSVYDNGIALAKSPGREAVHAGDHVWWDLHSTATTLQSPALVGSFPEPFLDGVGGQKLPTLLQCAPNVTSACDTVARALAHAGVKVAFQGLGTGSGSDSLAVLVGTFAELRGAIVAELIIGGPGKSGVYAKFISVGGGRQAVELDDAAGQETGTLDGTAGLIAATDEPLLNEPAWLVTGTDVRGVEEAAAAMSARALRDHYALAVSGGRQIPVPTPAGGP